MLSDPPGLLASLVQKDGILENEIGVLMDLSYRHNEILFLTELCKGNNYDVIAHKIFKHGF